MLKNKIPTIIGILLLLVGAVFGVIFVDQETGFLPRATPEYIPQKVKITNISHTGFTISWITQEPAIGFIKHGLSADDLTTTITDERDQITGSSGAYRSHYVTVQDLSPSTTYYFKIGSQGKQLYDNHGNAFSLTTAPQIPAPTAASTAYGTVLTPADTPAEGALVYLSLPGSTPLSALVKQNGNWTIDLATARTRDLSDYVTYHPQDTVVDIFLQADNGETAQIITKTNNIQPVPNIIIGKSADYSGKEPIYLLEQTPDPLHQSNFSIQEIMVTEPEASAQVTLDTIPADDTIITQSRPVLTGTAPPGAQITITIHSSQVITGSIIAGADGSWNWQPPDNINPGNHTITLSYVNDSGLLQTLTRTFVVQASTGDTPQYQATPSATLTPTRPPSPTTALSPTLAPTSPPPTSPPLASPTATPVTLRPHLPATDSAIPTAGYPTPTLSLSLLGLVLITAGLFFWKRSTV